MAIAYQQRIGRRTVFFNEMFHYFFFKDLNCHPLRWICKVNSSERSFPGRMLLEMSSQKYARGTAQPSELTVQDVVTDFFLTARILIYLLKSLLSYGIF